jgi:hypothetical protein
MRTVPEDDPKIETRRHDVTRLSTYRMQNEIRTNNMRISCKDMLQNEIKNNVRVMSKYKLQNEIRTKKVTNTE